MHSVIPTALTRQFMIMVTVGTLFVTAALVLLQRWQQEAILVQLRAEAIAALHSEWRQVMAGRGDHMVSRSQEFTRDATLITALSRGDAAAVAELLKPTFNRLSALGTFTGLAVVASDGTLLYNASRHDDLAAAPETLNKALTERKTVMGIDHTRDGHWGLVHAFPLFDAERRMVGGVAMFTALVEVVDEVSRLSGTEWLLSSHRQGFLYGVGGFARTQQALAAAEQRGAQLVKIAGRYVRVVTLNLTDTDGSEELHLTRLSDITEYVRERQARLAAELLVLGLVLACTLGWIYRFVVRTAAVLHRTQQQQIAALTAANAATAEAHAKLQSLHTEFCHAFAAKEVAQKEQLRLSHLNHALLKTAGEGILSLDVAGHIMFSNPAADRLLGYRSSELQGRLVATITGSALDLDEPGLAGVPRDGQFICRDQKLLPVAFTYASLVEQGVQSGAVVTFNDISARKAFEKQLLSEKESQAKLIKQLESAQNQLLQAEKLASIGQLAAGVAHEINNPVGYVNSNLGSLKLYVEQLLVLANAGAAKAEMSAAAAQTDLQFIEEDIRQLLQESEEGINRVKQIVQDLKDFSHVDTGEWSVADLHRGLDSTLNIVHNEIKYRAEVTKQYGTLSLVECLPAQINQVFANLLVNAAQAIEQHGKIWIRTGQDGNWVWVEVEDTGKGIAPENLQRIFEPFFTTKPVGKGTGLGLSVSYGIVEKHGGRIDVVSELGKGSRFRMWLPVSQVHRPVALAN